MSRLNDDQRKAALVFDNAKALDVLADARQVLNVPGSATAYDDALVEAVAELQAQQGLAIDGQIGPRTRQLLSRKLPELDASMLWPPAGANDEQKFAHYKSLCERLDQPLISGRPLLLAYRGVALRAGATHPLINHQEYDDSFVLLSQQNGVATVREFAGATHPYQTFTSAAPDANHDGTPDVGTIRPGRYVLERRDQDPKHPVLLVKRTATDDRIPTWRDLNHDGFISDNEKAASAAHTSGAQAAADIGDFSTAVLMHPGFTTMQANGKPFSSIGCQTARVEDVHAVAASAPSLDYLLLDGREVVQKLSGAPSV